MGVGEMARWSGVVVAVVAVVLALVTYEPTPDPGDLSAFGFADAWIRGEVVQVTEQSCPGSEEPCLDVVFEVTEGDDVGTFVSQTFSNDATAPDFEVGDGVYLSYSAGVEASFAYGYADRARLGTILLWGTVLAVAVVALGRWKGVSALVGVGMSLVVILGYVLPTLLAGGPPVTVAFVGATVIAVASIWLTHGVTAFSGVALLGTVGSLALTAALSGVAFGMARITGLASEEAVYLTLIPGVDISGLVLAGAVLGALGALDDVTITQASAVWEVRAANPSLDRKALSEAGLRVGRDHIASTVNTLVLAYAGASMPLLVLFLLSNLTAGQVLASEVVAVESMRTIVGSLGLVAAVPITTWLASLVAAGSPPGGAGGHSH